MSAASRQRTCALCGGELHENDLTDVEPLIDDQIRYIAIHRGHSTFSDGNADDRGKFTV